MTRCTCGADLPAGAATCPACGTPVAGAGGATSFLSGATKLGQPEIAVTDELAPGELFEGRYCIAERIGAGGMGVVYRAEDTATGRDIALKLVNTRLLGEGQAVARMIDEGLLTRDIRHANVVAVYDVARAGAQPYVTMEYLRGESLRQWLARQLQSGAEVSLEAAVGIVRAILDGLEAAHRTGVVHRDLKPENIMLLGDPSAGDCRLKIVDFGIARALGTSAMRTSGGAMGTPLYMAPEQRTSPEAAGPPADLYSLSRIFYELLMDVLPEGFWQPPSKHRADVPAGIDAMLETGLSARPRARQQSVGDYRAALDAAVAGTARGNGAPPPPAEGKDPATRPEQGGGIEPAGGVDDPPRKGPATGGGSAKPPHRTDPAPAAKPRWGWKKIGWAALAALLVAGVIEAALEEEDLSAPVIPSPYKPAPPTPTARADHSGTWYTDTGVVLQISHMPGSGRIEGVARSPDGTLVTLEGSLSGGRLAATLRSPVDPGFRGQVNGRMTDETHISYSATFSNAPPESGRIHLNHTPP